MTRKSKYPAALLQQVLGLHLEFRSARQISLTTGIPLRTVARYVAQYIADGYSPTHLQNAVSGSVVDADSGENFAIQVANGDLEITGPLRTVDVCDVLAMNHRLCRQRQNLMDNNRIERKGLREAQRKDSMLEAIGLSLVTALKEYEFPLDTKLYPSNIGMPVSVIQFSDLHINEVVRDLPDINAFDTYIASKRIHKHVLHSIREAKAYGTTECVLAFTGDLVKNVQHLTEITENSMARAHATMIMVDIIRQVIEEINQAGMNVTVVSVVGNEGRIMEHIHETNFLGTDSFDAMIHNMLAYLCADKPGVTVIPMADPFEQLIGFHSDKVKMLLVHGNLHGGIARTATIEKQVESLKSKWIERGHKIDYVIMGHIHQAFISDNFARSGGLPGTNQYALRKLNLHGRASQNHFLIFPDGAINGFKHDLQNIDCISPYQFDKVADIMSSNAKREEQLISGGNVQISYSSGGKTSLINSYTV